MFVRRFSAKLLTQKLKRVSPKKEGGFNMKQRVQKFGRFLSGMVMPNIGAFIAWGLITALFIPTGWAPNEKLAELVGPMITYLLPLLIGYTGGKMVGGVRGGVVGAIATAGVVVGADIPMFLGAMIMGPIGGWCIKKFDNSIEDNIPAGFEMLINNFSAGIIGAILAILAYLGIGPVAEMLTSALGNGVGWLVERQLLPLTSILVEPAKVLFLNNAINHGVFTPLGAEQAAEIGHSIFYMIESNPGPGLGLLLAYFVFGKGNAKSSSPGAMIIHFFGGIHEIYFPYVMMNPILIIAMIGGGASGVFTLSLLGGGLTGAASPGSIFAEMIMTPRGLHFVNLLGIGVAALVTFVLAALLMKAFVKDGGDLEEAAAKVKSMKNEAKGQSTKAVANGEFPAVVNKVVFACDAGMGSSAMAATKLRKKIKDAGIEGVKVVHASIEEIPQDTQVVVAHEELQARAREAAPQAYLITITDFLNAPEYDTLITELKSK